MRKVRKNDGTTSLGRDLIAALGQARKHARGEHVRGIRITTFPRIADIRAKLKLDQRQFAARFGLSVDSVQNWEQGRRVPDQPAKILLAVIAKHPEAVEDALAEYR